MRYQSFGEIGGQTPLVGLPTLFPVERSEVLAKLEFMGPSGSVKDRPARHVIQSWLASGRLRPGMRLVESTSGNFGVALAMYSGMHDLHCTLVVDPLVTDTNLSLMSNYGADVVQVGELDENGGYLGTRLEMVHKIVERDPDAVWVNQYANDLNWASHYHGTATEILGEVDGPIDVLVIALSTGGTLTGLARRLKEEYPQMRVVAVDAVGSVIFGGRSGPRRIPGIGASRRPELLAEELVDEVIHISDIQAAEGCHRLLRAEGIMAGGSSGAVVAAIESLLRRLDYGARILTVLPDRGERYLGLIYPDPSRPDSHIVIPRVDREDFRP